MVHPSLNLFQHYTYCLDSQAINFSNLYAPEHLIINVKEAEKWESFIQNAGNYYPCSPIYQVFASMKSSSFAEFIFYLFSPLLQ